MAIWDAPTNSLSGNAGLFQKTTVANSSLAFPIDLEKQPYWMSFSFYEYTMPNVNQQNVYYADRGTIRLPLPNSMVDDQKVQYNQEMLSTVTGSLVSAAQNGAKNNLSQSAATLLAGAAAGSSLSKISGTKGFEAIQQMAGAIVNPFLTVMFKQPAFKNHAFEWKLSPSNKDESVKLNSIVNMFKSNMLPDQTGALGGTLLTYPNIVQITVSVNDPAYFTYAFKPAVIEDFSVNYTVGGQPSFFGSTKAPTEVSIRLGLMEIEYWLSSDYGLKTQNKLANGLSEDSLKKIFDENFGF